MRVISVSAKLKELEAAIELAELTAGDAQDEVDNLDRELYAAAQNRTEAYNVLAALEQELADLEQTQ